QARHSVYESTHVAPADGRMLFSDWAAQWLTTRIDVRATSKVRDESYLRSYVLPTFGDRQLGQITHTDVAAWIAHLATAGRVRSGYEGQPLAPATVHKAYQTLSKIMRAAVLARRIAQSPCHDVPLPRIQRDEARFLTPDELITLEHAVEATERRRPSQETLPSRLALIVPFLADTGLRIGEAAALRWRDVDVDKGEVHVRETLVEVKGKVAIHSPKTRAGRR